MLRIFRRIRFRYAAVISAIATLSGIVSAMGLPPTPPFMRPFAADKKGEVIETVVQIKEHRNYYFMLVFEAGDASTRGKVDHLLAENYIDETRRVRQREPGVLHLQVWELSNGGDRLIAERNCRGYEGGGYGGSFIEARFVSLKLLPGKYRVRVKSLRGIEGLSALPVQVNFSIGYHPNSTPIKN
ncbi:MAG: hypothetical protein HZB40_04735 [Rhodocyclales bacterium]|nr:hypothetical protein [Rhodocyclales bacterium]